MVEGHLSETVPALCLLAALCSWRAIDGLKRWFVGLKKEVEELKDEVKALRTHTGMPDPGPEIVTEPED